MTQNHGLSTPPRGFQDWDEPLNDNFTSIDTKLPVVDLEANTGNYTPKEDAVFIASDTGAIFRGDGSSWNELPDSGPISLADDEAITFGTDDDYSIEYDSTNDHLQIRDAGAGNDAITVDSSQNINILNGVLNFSNSTNIQDAGTDVIQFDGSQNVSIVNGATKALDSDSNGLFFFANDAPESLGGTLGEESFTVTNKSQVAGGIAPNVISESSNDWSFYQFSRVDDDGAGSKVGVSTDGFLGVIRALGTDSDGSSTIAGKLQFKSGNTVASGVVSGKLTAELHDSSGSAQDVLTLLGDDGSVSVPSGDIQSGDTNSALELDERTSVADTGKVAISRDDVAQGYAMIQDVTNNVSTMVYLGGSANSVEIIHDSGSSNNFTTTEGNDGTTNIYWDSTNSRYELNNETGASATYAVEILKA